MADKEEDTIITITIELEQEEEEYIPSQADQALYAFTNTIHWYVKGFSILFIFGLISSLFS
ncbi:MAG: hypothetical protein CBC24_03960 [Candidatus Pelagibacter sp. TMED64]|nr:MAG: hypothetical protein CBC24_03960 [Candidatus Pelagibacter sp. TMED64]|tara:strand:+ start:308 stop:490 length:183 start_codon:yes stop_codon:yes gene_type:complete